MKKVILFILLGFTFTIYSQSKEEKAAAGVIARLLGKEKSSLFNMKISGSPEEKKFFKIETVGGKVKIEGNTSVSLTRGAYDYLKNACNSIISWSGSRINIPQKLPIYNSQVNSPYKYNYYFNVVTHGYTTAYWDWKRWEFELDWMAVHGIDMPLLGGAHEAILYRVFKKIGMNEKEISSYFTGPAYFPWNRMGNITGWNGPLPKDYFAKQVKLFHQILKRGKELGMHPIIPAFAGFVPEGIKRIYPDERLRELKWGGFDKKYQAYILEPGSELFVKIGREYIIEWEKEFGKGEFYLADSFNEMDVPLSSDHSTALKELAGFGESVYNSIKSVNPNAVWVMQGWTFPFHRDSSGKLFWTGERLEALLSKIPDEKLLILDMANEYNRLWWKSEPSWKMYPGFFNKLWIYSFIPNMGGKVPFNGVLDIYASIPVEALKYVNKKNLVGFGFAPEGIENNEIIYELLSDMGWRDSVIELNGWIEKYCAQRYSVCPPGLIKAYEYFNKSCFGSFTDHPRYQYQLNPKFTKGATVNKSTEFAMGVNEFLKCREPLKGSSLYKLDAIEIVSQFLGLKADEYLMQFKKEGDYRMLDTALAILSDTDRLLESHPNLKLSRWVSSARNWGNSPAEKDYYEADAKRLLTTWGGKINNYEIDDYAARSWSGLIRDYYMPRIRQYADGLKEKNGFDLEKWQEEWINKRGVSRIMKFSDPLRTAYELFAKYFKSK